MRRCFEARRSRQQAQPARSEWSRRRHIFRAGPKRATQITAAFRTTRSPDARIRRAGAYAAGASRCYGDIGDLDGDGRPDVATVNDGDDTVSVFLNLGSGLRGVPLTFPVGSGPSAVEVADLDRDGTPDVVIVNQGDGTVSALLSRRP